MVYINKAAYREKYLRLTKEYDSLISHYDCGYELAKFINPRIGELREQIDALVEEIEEARRYQE